MPPRNAARIPLSEVAKLEQLIDQEPAREQSAVSKRQAVAMLAPKLDEMRRKGYAWSDVAAWLSGHGITMSAAALQRHLRAVKDASARGSPRGRGKGPADGGRNAPRTLAATIPAAGDPTAAPPKASPPLGPPGVEPQARDLEPPKAAPGFTVRPDRKVI
ncbi:MAG: hypothetical protein ACRENE_14895 [Polyangiaceae bacterium]